MRNFIMAAIMVFSTIFSANAQYGNHGYENYGSNSYDDDRYYYDDEFDWHWDIRVRISNGIQNGLITRNESNRLYRRLEDVERKEYNYLADGVFNRWEQQEIWDDLAYLNRQVGIELYDYDRRFYGFDMAWNDLRGYPRWYYQGGFDFYRFDRRGFGNIRLGYVPRPNYIGWYRNDRNRVGREYYSERSRYRTNGSNGRYDNNRTLRNDNDRNPRGGGYVNNRRNDTERGSRGNNNPRNDNDRSSKGSNEPRNNNDRGSRGNNNPRNDNDRGSRGNNNPRNDNDRSSRGRIDNSRNNFPTPSTSERPSRGNDSPSRTSTGESRSDNYGRGSGMDNSRSERNMPNPSGEASTGNERRSRGGEASQAPSRSERSTPINESRKSGEAQITESGRGRRN
jgi:hypothetical protein